MIYDTLASYYDALVKDDQATQAWVEWIEEFTEPCSMLELACGSGEITHALAQDGFSMNALDLSSEMIEQARKKDRSVSFYCGDMRDLSQFQTYDAVACLCDSFNYLLDKAEVRLFFKEVFDHLNPHGLFFFDTHSLDRIEEFKNEYNETGHIDNIDYQWSITSEEDIIYQDFAFYQANGMVIQEHHMQRVYDPAWLEEVLSEFFDILSVRTDFDKKGIDSGEKYFYVCKKK